MTWVLCGQQHRIQLPFWHLATHLRKARNLTDAAVLQKDKCQFQHTISEMAVKTTQLRCKIRRRLSKLFGRPQEFGISLQVLQSRKYKKTTQAWWSRDWAKIFCSGEFIFLKQVIEDSKKEKLLLLHSKGHPVVSYTPSVNFFFTIPSLF